MIVQGDGSGEQGRELGAALEVSVERVDVRFVRSDLIQGGLETGLAIRHRRGSDHAVHGSAVVDLRRAEGIIRDAVGIERARRDL